jgi:hypothetical protein
MMRLILLLLLSLTASPALAGQRAVYAEPDGKTLTVEVADNGFARVRTGDPDQYGIWRDGQFYIVGREDGRVMVARIEDMAAAIDQVVPPIFKAMFEAVGTGPPASLRIEAKGKRRVAGHEGRVYAVYGIDKDKPKESADFVMSSEPALQPVGRAMEQFMIATIVPIGALIGTPPRRWSRTRARSSRPLHPGLVRPGGSDARDGGASRQAAERRRDRRQLEGRNDGASGRSGARCRVNRRGRDQTRIGIRT